LTKEAVKKKKKASSEHEGRRGSKLKPHMKDEEKRGGTLGA